MNKPFLLSATVVLVVGAFFHSHHRAQLASIRTATQHLPVVASASPQQSTWAPPPKRRPAPEGKLIDRLGETLISSLQPEQIAQIIESDDLGRLSLVLATELTKEESQMFERKYAEIRREKALVIHNKAFTSAERAQAFAALNARSDAWTAEQLGPERAAKLEAGRAAAIQAAAERNVTRMLSRVSQAADLSVEQKDRLYTSLLDRALHPLPSDATNDPALNLRVYATLKEEPAPPSLTEELKNILTSDQLAIYEQRSAAPARQHAMIMTAMQSMVPALIGTVQELLSEPADK